MDPVRRDAVVSTEIKMSDIPSWSPLVVAAFHGHASLFEDDAGTTIRVLRHNAFKGRSSHWYIPLAALELHMCDYFTTRYKNCQQR